MSVQVETLEKNMAKLTVTVSADKFEKAIQGAYNRQKGKIRVPGFRKGKVPRAMIEKVYGPEVFYDDAANDLINEEYPGAMDESGLEIVSRPEIEVTQIEKGKEFIFVAEVAVKPDVELGEYKNLSVTKVDTDVTEAEVDAELERVRGMQARTVEVTDRPAQQGDSVVIDFEGFVDGVPFEGGKGEKQTLELGSHSFIDTFEDQLVGHSAGDDVEVNVTFPQEYQAKELAGKPALFKVKVHSIKVKEMPELDDEFASMVSEYETLEEYKEEVKKNLAKRKTDEAKRTQEDEAVRQIIENSKMDIPEPMIDLQCDNLVQEFSERIARQGLTLEQYMQFSGATIEKMKEQVRPDALQRIQSGLVLEQVAVEEQIEVQDEEVDEQIAKMASAYGMTGEKMKEHISEEDLEAMKRNLSIEKALAVIMGSVQVKEKEAEAEAKEE